MAFDESELPQRLAELERISALPRIGSYATDEFVAALRGFIVGGSPQMPAPGREAA